MKRVDPRKRWTDTERKLLAREWLEHRAAEDTHTEPLRRFV